MASDKQDQCAKCGRPGYPLYPDPRNHKRDLCFDCLDAECPDYVSKYPGWRERETKKGYRGQVTGDREKAKKNLCHRDTETQSGLFL